jgi:hypothetical protein
MKPEKKKKEARRTGEPRTGTHRSSVRSRKRQAALVHKVMENIEKKLEADELKPSVGDLVRLLQLEKELVQEQPKEIKVSWVEPGEEERATDK